MFLALQRIGPRRNNILFALAAPFTIILNILILNEKMDIFEFMGCLFVFIGVVIAIFAALFGLIWFTVKKLLKKRKEKKEKKQNKID